MENELIIERTSNQRSLVQRLARLWCLWSVVPNKGIRPSDGFVNILWEAGGLPPTCPK